MIDSQTAQVAIAGKALDESTPADVRVSLFKSLAANAKFYGNRLQSDQIDSLESVVSGAEDASLRDAAAQPAGR